MKELLDTHVCSPLLLPESQSDEWVRRTITHHGDIICGGERFCQQQFECDRQWRHHITPHWRLRTMKSEEERGKNRGKEAGREREGERERRYNGREKEN